MNYDQYPAENLLLAIQSSGRGLAKVLLASYFQLIASYYPLIAGYYPLIAGYLLPIDYKLLYYPLIIRNDDGFTTPI